MLDLHKLTVFRQVAASGSFSRAADALYLTQSAVSQHVADLERGLGITLFVRSARGAHLTEAGQRLVTYADDIAQLVQRAEAEFMRRPAEGIERLVLSATTGIGSFRMPYWLDAFRAMCPGIMTTLHSCITLTALAELATGSADLAVIESEAQALRRLGAFTWHLLEPVRYCAIVGKGHELWGQNEITLSRLLKHSLVLRERASHTRAWLDLAFETRALHANLAAEYDTIEAIKRDISFGRHVGIQPGYAVQADIERGDLWGITISDKLERNVYVAFCEGIEVTPAAMQFVRFLAKRHSTAAALQKLVAKFDASGRKQVRDNGKPLLR